MNVLTLLIVAAAPIQFNGGSPNDLLKSIHESTGAAVVISPLNTAKYPAFSYEITDATMFSRAVFAATGLVQAPGLQLAFGNPTIPRDLVYIEPVYDAFKPWSSSSAPIVADQGAVTVHTKDGEGLNVDSLKSLKLDKPVVVHWTLNRMSLAAKADKMPVTEFFGYVAKATGSKFVNHRDRYELELSPTEFRARVQNTFKAANTPTAMKRLEHGARWANEMSQLALSLLTQEQIKQAFEERGSSVRIELSAAQKQPVYAKLNAFMKEASTLVSAAVDPHGDAQKPLNANVTGSRGGPSTIIATLNMIDTNSPTYLVFRANFTTSFEGIAKGSPSDNPQRVRVDFGTAQRNW